MSTETKPDQITGSVIAKLMGLDELPPQQPIQKKQRVLSENYLQRVSSIGVREKHSVHNSCRLSGEEQKDYSEVFQILETLKSRKRHSMSVAKNKIRSSSSGAKLMFTSEEFKQLTDVSKDTRLQSSKECHDAQEVIDSKTDNFPKYFQGPEFNKKANNLQDIPRLSRSERISVVKPLCPSDCRDIGRSRKFWRLSEQGYARKVEDGLATYSCGKLGLEVANEFLGSQLDLNDGSCLPTSRIVVLKSKPGKAQNAGRCFSSTGAIEVFHLGDRKLKEILNVQNGNLHAEVKERKNMDCDSGPAKSRSRFSKQISRKTTSEIRGSDTLPKESESMIPSLPVFSDRKNQFHLSDEPYLAREAKKQISERWKTTKKFQQVELVSRSKTLGEMLAIPNCESKPIKFAYNPDNSDKVISDSGGANSNTPLGIRSSEVWNDGHVRDLPKSRSLLVNFNTVASSKTMTRHKSLQKSSCKISPSIPHLPSKNNHSAEADYENKIEVNDPLSQSSPFIGSSGQNYQTMQDPWVTQEEQKNEGSDGHLFEQNSEVCKSSTSNVSSINVEVDTLASDTETAVLKRSLLYHELLELDPNNCVSPVKDENSSRDPPTSVQQDISTRISEIESVSSYCSGTDGDPESLTSMEDAYQPSPDSVLEPLFKKEFSSTSDCFESVGASLHGLQSHLELMKSEASETFSEGSGMMVSGDEDAGEGSVDDSEENDKKRFFRAEESRDFSYLVDVLSEAGFDSRNLQTGFDSWHSQEYPISSSVFETLEKKYGEQISWKRSERRLLYDRINSGLIEILQPSIGVPTWTKPVARRFSFGLGQEMIDEELWMLLVAQEKEAGKDSGKVLGKDDRWLELSDDVQIIVIEIENCLMDELVADVVCMENF
ncbi:unnamed protein product [Dovyalis caffra]|uniref:Rhodanese domain-containing protein n=1 Tax=Dovyalis caffra TaxID=77055 RepID=A0AAV1QX28_9ROSI|nr:unnamed protein product [Dovyalis caffra]